MRFESQSRKIKRLQLLRRRDRRSKSKVYGSPEKIKWEIIKSKYDVISIPAVLGWVQPELSETVEFVQQLHERLMTGTGPVFLDFSRCRKISAPGAMLLAAEVERCQALNPRPMAGRDPISRSARYPLNALGFYDRAGFKPERAFVDDEPRRVMKIQSGSTTETTNPGEQTYQVAKLAFGFKDEIFADRVHGALNEATDNVISWAYDPEFLNPNSCIAGKWWVAGVFDEEHQRAFFFALDHGVGIPVTAPKNLGESLWAALSGFVAGLPLGTTAPDHHILQATIRERRTRSQREGRGKGLTRMIELVDLTEEGTVWITSGRGQYLYWRERGQEEPFEKSSSLSYTFPGTLVVWDVSAPRTDLEHHER